MVEIAGLLGQEDVSKTEMKTEKGKTAELSGAPQVEGARRTEGKGLFSTMQTGTDMQCQ